MESETLGVIDARFYGRLPAPRTSRRLCGNPLLADLVSALVVFSF
jgi:hypothetical protein